MSTGDYRCVQVSTGANKSSESSERKIKEDDKVQSDFILTVTY